MSFQLKIRELISDNYSGSAAILDKIIRSIQTYINNREIDQEYLRTNLDSVTNHFPDLAVLHHFMQQFYDLLDEMTQKDWPVAKTISKIERFISSYNETWNESIGQAAERMERLGKIQQQANSASQQQLKYPCTFPAPGYPQHFPIPYIKPCRARCMRESCRQGS
jgi:GTP1/Obg family GTP-binding protein